ncbi:MAG TPA: cyclodeaminase/cyclohydrolase family protein [Chloroflexota bacterium]|nr:cyclodeaminase/cyclohydrolase family protein [Chloroflexota bacterium]
MPFAALTIDDFGARLGSAEPTPGGGAAAALLAKLGASLVQMVGRHTVGRPKYAAIEGKVQAAIDEAERLDARAGELMDADGDAYAGVSAAFKLPKEEAGRARALSAACVQASKVPLEVMRLSARVGELALELFREGNQSLSGDARAALLMAQTAAEISLGNVRANQPFIEDAHWAQEAAAEAGQMRAHIAALREQIERS